MKKYFALIVFAALAAVSCTDSLSEDKASVSNNGTVFTLRLAPITKATVDVSSGSKYDLKWTDDDKIAFKLSDDSTVESSVSVSGSKATVSVDLTGGKTIVDAWYPSNGMVKLTAIPASQSANSVNVPLELDNISGTTLTFRDIQDWAVVRVTLSSPSATRIGDARTLAFVKIKNNNGSALPDQIQINSNVTLSDTPNTFDFVVPADECKPIEIIVRDSNGKEYRRKMSSNQSLESHKLYTLPEIADIDDTGKHVWIMGSTASSANTAESPIPYWWKQSGASNSTTIDVSNVVLNDGYMTVTMDDKGSDKTTFQSWVSAIFNKFYSADGASVSNARNSGFHVYANTVPAGQIPFVAVHSGNYPIFAIKMSNPVNYGTSRKIRLQTDSREALDGLAAEVFVDGMGNGDNKYSVLSGYESTDETVLYYNLSTANVGGKGVLPNTRVIPFKTWQLRFYDITYTSAQDTAPTYNIYWAGFFNSVSELEAFAAAH